MTCIVRPSRIDDLDSIYEMAKLTGGGFTNLPADRGSLEAKLERSAASFAKAEDTPGDDLYLLVLEDTESDRIVGTGQIFSMIGQHAPFYSYRIGTLTQQSKALARTFRAEMLTLTSDYEGCSEVGGLFLHPNARAGGLGMLLARSRYLFIRVHRARFADTTIAELRGVIDEAAGSPFWDGLAGKFFGMSFQEADEFNAVNGHQFIADLMPKHPIYLAMLPESARHVIGLPHPSGRAAMRMLETEGFSHEGYIDIFDGGPTMEARTDSIRAVKEAKEAEVGGIGAGGSRKVLLAAGRLEEFRCGLSSISGEGRVKIDPAAAAALWLASGDRVLHVGR